MRWPSLKRLQIRSTEEFSSPSGHIYNSLDLINEERWPRSDAFPPVFLSLFRQEPYHFMFGSDEFALNDTRQTSQTPDGPY